MLIIIIIIIIIIMITIIVRRSFAALKINNRKIIDWLYMHQYTVCWILP